MVLSVNPFQSSFPVDYWIIDSGASAHIACSLSLFDSYHNVHNKFVTLPNKNVVSVTAIGTITLNHALTAQRPVYSTVSIQFVICQCLIA